MATLGNTFANRSILFRAIHYLSILGSCHHFSDSWRSDLQSQTLLFSAMAVLYVIIYRPDRDPLRDDISKRPTDGTVKANVGR
jgi:hypothetical protein